MTTVSSVSNATTTAAASSAANANSPENMEDRFLKLLVAQIKHQDPLSPLDNSQVTSQMAQISTVSGIDKLNATIQSLMNGFTDTQALQATSLMGRDVLIAGNALTLEAGNANGGFELAEAADNVKLEIRDAAGHLVHSADLGAQKAGVHSFQWDGVNDAGGAMAAGAYTFSVVAMRGGQAVSVDPLAGARVLAVSRGADGTQLELAGVGARSYTSVKQIL